MTLLLLLAAPVLFYLPGLFPGRVLLPVDILCGSLPWSAMQQCAGRTISNPVLSDQIFQFYPWHEIVRRDGWPAALWNPYAFAGSPLLANGQSAPLYPLNWLHWILPPEWSYALLAVLRTALATVFTWMFARRCVSDAAAAMAAVAYGFSYTFVFAVGYPIGDAMIWLPALLWAVQPMRPILLALFTAMELLAGQPETTLVVAATVGVWWLSRRPSWRALVLGGAAVTAGFLVALPQLLPMFEYVALGAASRFRAEYNPLFYSAHTLLEFLTPEFFGTSAPQHRWGSNEGGFFGLLPLLLAVAMVVSRPRQVLRNPFLWIFAASLGFIYRIPPFSWILELPMLRTLFVTKFWASATFAAAMLAAHGLDEFRERRIPAWLCFRVLPFAGCAALAAAFWQFSNFIAALHLERFEQWVAAKFAVSLLLALAVLRWRPQLAAVLVFAECAAYLGGYNTAAPKELLFPRPPVVDFLKRDPERFRIMGDGVLPANTAGVFGLEDLRGYDAITYRPYFEYMTSIDRMFPDLAIHLDLNQDLIAPDTLFMRDRFLRPLEKWDGDFRAFLQRAYYWNERLTRVEWPLLLDILNVKYYLVPHGSRPPPGLEDYELVYAGEVDVFRNPHVRPRAFVEGGGSAEILSYRPNEVIVRATGPGKLVLADTWYPGWRAGEFRIELVDGLLRGVQLPAGSHTVRFSYRPWR